MTKIAIVGVTGLVGQTMIKVLERSKINISEIVPVASERSVGRKIFFKGEEFSVIGMKQAVSLRPKIALFSAGGTVSKEWAPKFAQAGITVIDNSSAWRMESNVPLVVPSVNGDILNGDQKIISNPNCSTIQLVMAIAPLHKAYGIKRMVISTYQSVTGTGVKAVKQMENERNGIEGEMVYHYKIDGNVIPHCDSFTDNGYTKEEMKLVNETRKIFNDASIAITATAVRVPTTGGHSESVNITFNKEFDIDEVVRLLQNAPEVVVLDNPQKNEYPMPLISAGTDKVYVGRIRRDDSYPRSLNMWIVADNLRIGAATNAVWIAEHLVKNVLK
ncbi:MAG: aspartate-semialdehyde dehydrogenase [Salinivirgaceae bacterium]|jgi:aspartate-semialdehyde dehydrogenase|nr:aspartate-semialdehyde dehydrogenase [Bacteroidales bacterium]